MRPVAVELVEGRHPLAALLVLAEEDPGVSDDDWSRAHETVEIHLGRALAAAAARGKLVAYVRQSSPHS